MQREKIRVIPYLVIALAGLLFPPRALAACDNVLTVRIPPGPGQYGTIGAALNSLGPPATLKSNWCVNVDSSTYSEQVTIQNFSFQYSTDTLTIQADPALSVSTQPTVNPPVSSTAAFLIINSSVNIFGINIISTNSVQYGIYASSSQVNISSVNVDSGGNIWNAGVYYFNSSINNCSLSYSSVTVQNANAIRLAGTSVNLSYSSATSNTNYAITTGSNYFKSTWTAVNVSSGGASFSSGGNNLYVSYSTFTSHGSGITALNFIGSNSTVTASAIINDGLGVSLELSGTNNVVSQSTVTGNAPGYPGVFHIGATGNLVDHVTVNCLASPVYRCLDLESNNNVIQFSTVAAISAGTFYIGGSNNTIYGNIITETGSIFTSAFDFESGSNNTLTGNIVTAAGDALFIKANPPANPIRNNLISQSTFTSTGSNAVFVQHASTNTFANLYVQSGPIPFLISGSTGTIINASVIISPNNFAVKMDNTNGLNLSMSSNTLLGGGGLGSGSVFIDKNNAGNIIFSTNTFSFVSGVQYGLRIGTQTPGTQIWITSNTFAYSNTTGFNTYGIHLNGLQTGATIQNNGILLRQSGGVGGNTYYGIYGQSISGVNVDHNRINNPGSVTAGSYVGAYFTGTQQTAFTFNDVNSTGTGLTNAYLMQLVNSTVTIKDNVFLSSVSVTGSSASITADVASGVNADYNDWYSSNSANALTWGSNSYQFPWSGSVGQDANSIAANPRWSNPSAGIEDFHPQSQQGRWDQAAGVLDNVDCATPLTIDAADPAQAFSNEPSPNGARANQGSYGNTAQASETFVPALPASFSASAPPIGGTIFLSWADPTPGSCSSYVNHYNLSVALAQAGPYTLLGSLTATTSTQLGLNSATTYYYQVVTVDTRGFSSLAAQAFALTPDTAAPAQVTNLAGLPGPGLAQAALTWTYPGDDNGTKPLASGQYAIQFTTDPTTVVWSTANAQVSFSTSSVGVGVAQSTAVSGLSQLSTYYFTLWSAHINGGLVSWSTGSNVASSFAQQAGPVVLAITPADGAFGMALSTTVFVSFNKTVTFSSLSNALSVTLARDNLGNSSNTVVAGALSPTLNSSTYTFTPNAPLTGNGTYRVVIATTALDLASNHLLANVTAQFLTVLDNTVTNVIALSTPSITITVPAGALAAPGYVAPSTTTLSSNLGTATNKLTTTLGDPSASPVASSLVDLKAYDTLGNVQTGNFASPLTITLSYPNVKGDGMVDGMNPPVRADTLGIWWLDDANALWVRLPTSGVNTAARTVTAQTIHFTTFGLIGQSATSLDNAYAFPVPLRASRGQAQITFTGLGQSTRIRIFTVAGELVRELNSSNVNGQLVWDVTNSDGKAVASGVYLYLLQSGNNSKKGKLVIIR